MTEEIFRRDGYAFEFEAVVVSVEGDLVELDITAFYPGGGGQVCDTGTIMGQKVTEVMYKGENIVHRVPGNKFKEKDVVWCSVDWDRRFDLMMGHTGEHLLFCSLKRQDPDLTITKIFISPESKYVIVNHDLTWEQIRNALVFANQAIRDDLPVTKTLMSIDDPELEKVRIKKERIEGTEVSVVAIGDIDLSACSGVHVMDTSELEMLFVDRKVSAGKEGIAIHFKVGNEAKDAAMSLANTCLQVVDEANSKPEDIVRAVSNMKHEIEIGRELSKAATKQQISTLEPETINGIDVYSGVFATTDKTILIDAAEAVKEKKGVAVFVSKSDTAFVILASGTDKVNCKTMLTESLAEFGGRGGGKPDFSQGGIPDASSAEKLLASLLSKIRSC